MNRPEVPGPDDQHGRPFGADGQGHGGVAAPSPGGATLNEALSLVIRTLLAGRRTMVTVTLAVLVPFQLLAGFYLGRLIDADTIDAFVAGQGSMADLSPIVMASGLVMIVGLALGVVVSGAVVATAHAGNLRLSPGTALRIGLDRSGAALGANVVVLAAVVGVLLAVGVILAPISVIAPAVGVVLVTAVVMVVIMAGLGLSYLVIPVAVLEARGPVAAFKRAAQLGWAAKGRLVGLMAMLAFVFLLFALVLSIVAGVLTLIAPAMTIVVDLGLTTVLTLITAPTTALAGYVVWCHATGGR